MTYTKIAPLGIRIGLGTYDGVFDTQKYNRMEEAIDANDLVVIDFVKDNWGDIYFSFWHTHRPTIKLLYRLDIQHFPKGVDTRDDTAALEIARTMLAGWPTDEDAPEGAYDLWLMSVRYRANQVRPTKEGQLRCPYCGSKDLTGEGRDQECSECGRQFQNPWAK